MAKIIQSLFSVLPKIRLTCERCSSLCEYGGDDGKYLRNPRQIVVWGLKCPACGFTFRHPNMSFYDLPSHDKDGKVLPSWPLMH